MEENFKGEAYIIRKFTCLLVIMALMAAPCTAFGADYFNLGMKQGDIIMRWADFQEHLTELKKLNNPAVKVYALTDLYDPVWLTHEEVANNGTITVVDKEFTMKTAGLQKRDLNVIKLGTGEKVVWVQAQIHGNEKHTTLGLMKFIWEYASDPAYAAQFKDLTIYAIPMYNPDGSILAQRGTDVYNDAGVRTNANLDLNRDWKVNLLGEGQAFVASESRAFYRLYCDLQPDFAYDLHHQGAKTTTANCVRTADCNKEYPTVSRACTGSFGTSVAADHNVAKAVLGGKHNSQVKAMQKYIFEETKDDLIAAYNASGSSYTNYVMDFYSYIEIFGGVISGMYLGINYCGLNPYHYSTPTAFLESELGTSNNTTVIGERNMAIVEQNFLVVQALAKGLQTNKYLNDPYYEASYWSIPHGTAGHGETPGSRDYNTTSYNQLVNGTYVHPVTGETMNMEKFFSYLEPTLLDTWPGAAVEKLDGSKNKLTVTVYDKYSDKSVKSISESFTIDNNAVGTYVIGDYIVYVNTRDTQVREVYFTDHD